MNGLEQKKERQSKLFGIQNVDNGYVRGIAYRWSCRCCDDFECRQRQLKEGFLVNADGKPYRIKKLCKDM